MRWRLPFLAVCALMALALYTRANSEEPEAVERYELWGYAFDHYDITYTCGNDTLRDAARAWAAVSGEAVSFGTVLAEPLPAHLEAIEIPAQPSKRAGTRWDAATKAIVAIPAQPPPPDRVSELLADETVVAITAKLSAGERAALVDKLRGKFS